MTKLRERFPTVTFVELDADEPEDERLAQEFEVDAFPTFVVTIHGAKRYHIRGLMPYEDIAGSIGRILDPRPQED